MKKYFEKKSLFWYLRFWVLFGFIGLLLIPVFHEISVSLGKSLNIIYLLLPIFSLMFLFAGKRLVKRLQKDGEYEGEYGRYTYVYYPLICAATALIGFMNTSVGYIFGTVRDILNSPDGNMSKAVIVCAIYCILLIADLVVASKITGSLLCAVTEGEDSEKMFFSKICFPVIIIMEIVLLAKLIFLFWGFSLLIYISSFLCYNLLALMLFGLKYKYDDIKIRNIICKVLPFVYVGIEFTMVMLKIFNVLY